MYQHYLQAPHNARILYVDMNGFFASIEQQDFPELREKPVAVVSHRHPHGTVLASSYEAKARGVVTGTKLQEAQARCPNLAIRETRPERYRQLHHQIMAILRDVTGPEVTARSIDEAAIFLSPNWQTSEHAHHLAGAIKNRFRSELGAFIRCSIGIGPNTSLAKLGTDLQKPDGLVEITLENTAEKLATIPLTALCGIAHRMARQLEAANIPTPLAFYQQPLETLRQQFGIWGQYWWWNLHGYEYGSQSNPMKTMSHEHVLPYRVSTQRELIPLFGTMADRLAFRLCRNGYQTHTAWVSFRLVDAPRYTAFRRFDAPLGRYTDVYTALLAFTEALPAHFAAPIRKIALGFGELSLATTGIQLPLAPLEVPLRPEATSVLLAIRQRYGFESICPGTALLQKSGVLREQVGFGRIRDHT